MSEKTLKAFKAHNLPMIVMFNSAKGAYRTNQLSKETYMEFLNRYMKFLKCCQKEIQNELKKLKS